MHIYVKMYMYVYISLLYFLPINLLHILLFLCCFVVFLVLNSFYLVSISFSLLLLLSSSLGLLYPSPSPAVSVNYRKCFALKTKETNFFFFLQLVFTVIFFLNFRCSRCLFVYVLLLLMLCFSISVYHNI